MQLLVSDRSGNANPPELTLVTLVHVQFCKLITQSIFRNINYYF